MAVDTMTFEYQLSRIELSLANLRLPWVRRVGMVGCLFAILLAFGNQRWWLVGLYSGLAVECWSSFTLLGWCIAKLHHLLLPRFTTVQIETDEKGLRIKYHVAAKTSPTRYWWSRLSEMKKDNEGLLLLFDRGWVGLFVPWKAFESDEQRDQFWETAKGHLNSPCQKRAELCQ